MNKQNDLAFLVVVFELGILVTLIVQLVVKTFSPDTFMKLCTGG